MATVVGRLFYWNRALSLSTAPSCGWTTALTSTSWICPIPVSCGSTGPCALPLQSESRIAFICCHWTNCGVKVNCAILRVFQLWTLDYLNCADRIYMYYLVASSLQFMLLFNCCLQTTRNCLHCNPHLDSYEFMRDQDGKFCQFFLHRCKGTALAFHAFVTCKKG